MRRALSRILLVEDDPDLQDLAAVALGRLGGFESEICSSGREALARAAAFAPDMILLDVMMPGMDGPATLSALREIPEVRDTPVVFITAKCQPHEIEEYRQLGCIDVIAKPFVPTELPETLRRLWDQHEARGGRPVVAEASTEFAALRQVYLSAVPSRLQSLEEAARGVIDRGAAEDIEWLRTLAHRLVGSSALYGLSAVSEVARRLETFCTTCLKEGPLPVERRRTELDSLVRALWSSIELPVRPGGESS